MSESMQPSMFDVANGTGTNWPPADAGGSDNPRQAVVDATLERANAVWRERYEAFIVEHLRDHGPSTGEEIRLAYLSDPTRPRTTNEKASGGIFAKLRYRQVIVEAGRRRSKKFGNMLAVYDLKK